MSYNFILALVSLVLMLLVVVVANPAFIPTLVHNILGSASDNTELAHAQPPTRAPRGGGNFPLAAGDELQQEAGEYARPPRLPPKPPKKPLFEGGFNWKVAAVLFGAEFLGVYLSFTVTQPVLKAGQSIFGIALLIAAANVGASLSTRAADAPIKAAELFQYLKDGLVWPAAVPTIATALGIAVSATKP